MPSPAEPQERVIKSRQQVVGERDQGTHAYETHIFS